MTRFDLILVGGGLANCLLAWRLHRSRPELRFVLLERGAGLGGNHTWCFHEADLTPAQLEHVRPLVRHRWATHQVVFPGLQRTLSSPYHCIPSASLAEVLMAHVGGRVRLATAVRALGPTSVVLENGEQLEGTVVDGRGFRNHPAMRIKFQSFLGQEMRFAAPHGLTAPVIMDATTSQSAGYRFTYVLPFSPTAALVEDTGYVDDGRLDRPALERRIAEYCAGRGWRSIETLRTESGVLPITLAGDVRKFWSESEPVARVGLAGGFFHPTTGYSLPDAVRIAELIGSLPNLEAAALFAALRGFAEKLWREQAFFRALNRMLFLAGHPNGRWRVMQRFYGLPGPLIERFYAGRLRLSDKARILAGRPPVPVHEALLALVGARAAGALH